MGLRAKAEVGPRQVIYRQAGRFHEASGRYFFGSFIALFLGIVVGLSFYPNLILSMVAWFATGWAWWGLLIHSTKLLGRSADLEGSLVER